MFEQMTQGHWNFELLHDSETRVRRRKTELTLSQFLCLPPSSFLQTKHKYDLFLQTNMASIHCTTEVILSQDWLRQISSQSVWTVGWRRGSDGRRRRHDAIPSELSGRRVHEEGSHSVLGHSGDRLTSNWPRTVPLLKWSHALCLLVTQWVVNITLA